MRLCWSCGHAQRETGSEFWGLIELGFRTLSVRGLGFRVNAGNNNLCHGVENP